MFSRESKESRVLRTHLEPFVQFIRIWIRESNFGNLMGDPKTGDSGFTEQTVLLAEEGNQESG